MAAGLSSPKISHAFTSASLVWPGHCFSGRAPRVLVVLWRHLQQRAICQGAVEPVAGLRLGRCGTGAAFFRWFEDRPMGPAFALLPAGCSAVVIHPAIQRPA